MKININKQEIRDLVKEAVLKKIAGYMLAQTILDLRK